MASASEILKAYLHCARTPAEDAVERIRTQLKKQYGAAEVELTVSVEPDLISGYVLQVAELEQNGKVQAQWEYFKTEQHKRRRAFTKAI